MRARHQRRALGSSLSREGAVFEKLNTLVNQELTSVWSIGCRRRVAAVSRFRYRVITTLSVAARMTVDPQRADAGIVG